jgi:hypothetical protein
MLDTDLFKVLDATGLGFLRVHIVHRLHDKHWPARLRQPDHGSQVVQELVCDGTSTRAETLRETLGWLGAKTE